MLPKMIDAAKMLYFRDDLDGRERVGHEISALA